MLLILTLVITISSVALQMMVCLIQWFQTWGTPEVFQGVHRGLVETKVMCNGAIMLSLCMDHEGEHVFL